MADRLGQGIDPVERQSERLADIAHGGFWPVSNELGRHAGAVASVFLIDILNHFFATLMFEVDVDIGGFVAILGDEPLEQDVDAIGVDGRDAQAVANDRVGRRAASLAEDLPGSGEANQVPHGQEVSRIIELVDDRQLALDQVAHLGGNAAWIAIMGAGRGELSQVGNGRFTQRAQFLGIFVSQFIQ